MHSACGMTADASMSGIGDSMAHGDEKSAVKNTAPDSRTTRSTSDRTSTPVLSRGSTPLSGGTVKNHRGPVKPSRNSSVRGKTFGVAVIEPATLRTDDRLRTECHPKG